MPRRHGGLFDELVTASTRLPWWLALLLAAIAFLILHPIASHELAPPPDPQSVGPAARAQLLKTLALFGQYVFPAAFIGGAVLSAFGRRKHRRLHGDAPGDDGPAALQAMSREDFELLVGEAFRRQGYRVREPGGNGPDGGVDLVGTRDEQHYLVQCKHWKSRQVGVRTVRELYGVMSAQRAAGAFVVTSGVFTREAQAFAYDKNVLLIDGPQLLRLLRVARGEAGEYHLLGAARLDEGPSEVAAAASPAPAPSPARWLLPMAALTVVLVTLGALYTALQPFRATAGGERSGSRGAASSPAAVGGDSPSAPKNLEAAFELQYMPPGECARLDSDRRVIECANHYIRARRAYMEEHRPKVR
ncbi:MAG: restriction endonuclease [Gammaproteobacteria bacterium]